MFSFFLLTVRLDFLERYRKRTAFVIEAAAVLLGLTIYWYTAKAFAPAFSGNLGAYGNYFHFVLVGELALLVPISLLEGVARAVRKSQAEGTLELFLSGHRPVAHIPILLSLAVVPRDFSRVLLSLGLAAVVFGFRLPVAALFLLPLLQLLALPLFLAIGMLAASVLVLLGKGEHIVTYLGAAIMAFSGAYFPLEVLPEKFVMIVAQYSPYALFLRLHRDLLSQGVGTENFFRDSFLLFSQGALLFPIAYFFLTQSFRMMRRRGTSFLLHR